MCGICGKVNIDGTPVDGTLIGNMAEVLAHRGPDDSGFFVKDGLGLGHRRLSVIDLSAAAHQPMGSDDGILWIVFNGEIYNFISLKEELLAKGHSFRSNSDTEVILHLYREEGTDCVKRLRGMFAFAIWDEREKSLFLARDRVGKKPLFYYHDQKSFVFGSEIKAILQDPSVPRKPDYSAIHHYLTWQCVPAPFSAFEGIRKLPPAHTLLLKGGRVEIQRYWKLDYLPKHSISFEELKSEIVERLKEATRLRMISDVPLGAFLSGGVDSSAVVALMAGISTTPVKTFSIGFKESAYNELPFARMVAQRFGTDHTEFIVEPDAVEVLPKLVWHYNEPFADSSAIPSYYVAKMAREHVTVVLNGDGGDENFAGYSRYAANLFADRLSRFFPPQLAKLFLPLAMALPHGSDPTNFFWRLKRFLQEYVKSPELRNASWMSHFTPEMKKGLYTADFAGKVDTVAPWTLMVERFRETDAVDFTDKSLYADVMMYLPDDLLVKMDVATMASSLEARSPFLDHEFMEFVARIPAHYKLKGMTTKHILKEAFRGILPDDVLFREKMGFAVPIDHWFRKELKEMAYDTLLDRRSRERGYFNYGYVKQILDEHVSGQWNWQHHIYNLLMLELWHRQFIDGG
jgi:asparagine synthase (glutamine-hydrolysing)